MLGSVKVRVSLLSLRNIPMLKQQDIAQERTFPCSLCNVIGNHEESGALSMAMSSKVRQALWWKWDTEIYPILLSGQVNKPWT